ncbi:MAG: ATP-binding protein [Myxococcota bacterium]
MRLSIATKIFLAFAAVVITFTSVLMFGIYRTQELYSRIQRLNHTIVPVSLLLSDVQTDLKSFSVVLNERDPLVLRRTLQMTRLVYFLPDQFTNKVERARSMVTEADLEELSSGADTFELASRLSELQRRSVEFARQSRAFTELVLDEKVRDDREAYRQDINQRQQALRADARSLDQEISQLRGDLREATDTALAQANDNQRSSLYALGILSALTLLLAVGVLIAVVYTLRPLTDLTEATKRIGEGDYRPIEGIAEDRLGVDEITTLTREFNSMAESLAERDAKLREQHQQLLKSERLATIGQMTSLITHELRNPLSSINLNSEMLQEALVEQGIDRDDDDVMPLLETIIDEVDRLRDITEEYLVYARLPSPKFEPRSLNDILQSLIDFHVFEWSQQGAEVAVELPDDPPEVLVDGNQLRQALLNILRNAIEANPDGGTVRVEVERGGEVARIVVSDEGPGIDADILDQIFDPFFTTKSNGTGIGLAMTQQIVEEHNGRLAVESSETGGARFVIDLPLVHTEAA